MIGSSLEDSEDDDDTCRRPGPNLRALWGLGRAGTTSPGRTTLMVFDRHGNFHFMQSTTRGDETPKLMVALLNMA
jgi:hypothetical protein